MADQVFQSGLRAPSNKARTGPMRFGKREQSAPLSLANTNISVVARPIEPRRPSLGLAPPQPSRNRLTSPLSSFGVVVEKAAAVLAAGRPSELNRRDSVVSVEIFHVGDRVWVKKDPSGRSGIVRFVGPTAFAEGTWVGIELDPEFKGKHGGTVNDVVYFTCDPSRGVFMLDNKLTAHNPALGNGVSHSSNTSR